MRNSRSVLFDGAAVEIGAIPIEAPASGSTTYYKSLAGSLTPTGLIIRKTTKKFTGSVSPSGALSRQVVLRVLLQGTVSASGTLRKLTKKATAGAISATGTVSKKTSRLLQGAITSTGSVLKKVTRIVTGSITASGVLTTRVVVRKATEGVMTLAGALSSFKFTPVIEAITSSLTHLRRFAGRR